MWLAIRHSTPQRQFSFSFLYYNARILYNLRMVYNKYIVCYYYTVERCSVVVVTFKYTTRISFVFPLHCFQFFLHLFLSIVWLFPHMSPSAHIYEYNIIYNLYLEIWLLCALPLSFSISVVNTTCYLIYVKSPRPPPPLPPFQLMNYYNKPNGNEKVSSVTAI